jgi:SAM-dependent methyltransferase
MKKITLLKLITLLSAFLLFQIELIIAKILLPDYGGSYMVWGACMVFFQATLLAGYWFSHVFIKRLGISNYLILHLVLLLIPLLFFPGRAIFLSEAIHTHFLSLDVFGQLLFTIGPVFFLLCTMSIVTQIWLANSELPEKEHAYTLYAWSNVGSFAALLTYPFLFEYFFDLSAQLFIWRIGYILLIILNGIAWYTIPRKQTPISNNEPAMIGSDKFDVFRCFLLGAGGVMIFMSVTTIITVEIAPIPLVWIIPLTIFLLSFVLNFKQSPWYPQWIDKHIQAIIGLSILLFFLVQQQNIPVAMSAITILFLLFCTSMYAQHQVFMIKPSGAGGLTRFYLILSLGGFAGGLITAWIVPLISNILLEYLLALLVIVIALPLPVDDKKNKAFQFIAMVLFVVILLVWPYRFPGNSFIAAVVIGVITWFLFSYFKTAKYAILVSLVLVILLSSLLEKGWTKRDLIYQKRNFYGVYQIYNTGRIRRFRHGATLHGTQIMDPQNPQNQTLPTTYYGLNSPVASILGPASGIAAPRIAAVGLGAGTLAAYLRPGQTMDFYELDPEVIRIAGSFFTYLGNAQGKVNFFAGDGRQNLKSNSALKYDIIVIDAFNGDAVPYHLITKEMVQLCRQRLNPNGILLYHLSNRYFSLDKVLGKIAQSLNIEFSYKNGTVSGDNIEELSLWGAFTWNNETHNKLAQAGWIASYPAQYSGLRVWTDQYSSVLPVMKFDQLFGSVFSW